MSPDTRTESGGYEIRSKIGLDKFSFLMEWKVESQFVKHSTPTRLFEKYVTPSQIKQEQAVTPERWKQIDELAQAALERGVVEREGFLDQACAGDDTLRREVESHIAYQQQASKFLEEPAFKQAADFMSASQTEIESMEGRTIGRYRILRTLGAGGMGEVYLAEDTRLKRKVALKLLPAEFTQDMDRVRRFEQEAQAASALNHPNIITIHEIGEVGGAHYIVTEYVPGETLRARMKSDQPGLDGTLEIVLQVAGALAVAHEAGIIHRDIKPENVMVRDDGLVKVLDFGLAKLTGVEYAHVDTQAPTEAQQVTASGVVLGTAAYMSPEQARGLKVDARTDIFSLGVMLYEMIAGHKPFEGATTSDVIAAVLLTEPQALSRYSPNLPETLERIVSKALAKDREERHQTVKEMALALTDLKHRLESEKEREGVGQPRLKDVAVASSEQAGHETGGDDTAHTGEGSAVKKISRTNIVIGKIKSHKLIVSLTLAGIFIAAFAAYFYFNRKPVLTDKDTILLTDFTNTTGDAVFDGALKQALAVQLGQSPFLNLFSDERVRETLRLMNRSPDEHVTPTIGREICQRQGLKGLLAGSISGLGSHYVITLEAINARTGEAIAREQGEAEGKEQVLRSLGESATRLRGKLGESLSSIQRFDAPLEATTSSLDALKAFSVGNELNLKGKVLESIASLKHAVELDPKFAYAYALLETSYTNSKQPELAAEAAQKAFELRDRVSEHEKFHIAASYYAATTGEIDKAIEALELCTQTYPRDDSAHHNLGFQYGKIGQSEKSVEEYRDVVRLNPSRGMSRSTMAGAFIRLNRFEEAKAMGEEAIALKFDNAGTRTHFYNIAFIQRDTAGMKQQVEWASGRPGEYAHLNWQAGAAAFAGQWQKARDISNRSAELTEQRKLPEEAGNSVSSNAEWAAVLSQCRQSRADLARAAALPRTPLSFFRAGIALALCGEAAQAQALNEEAVKRYPKNQLVNEIYLPLIRAELEIQRGNRAQAIQMLEAVSRYESVTFFHSNYLRGQAYLGERNGAAAARQFQKILDHQGWSPLSPLYPLAHLGLARAAMLEGDKSKARKSYQDFLALWKDADADLPILIEAKKEYEKLR